jgi:hypothetical protein
LNFPNQGVDSSLAVTSLVRKTVNTALAIVAGLFSLPSFIFGCYFIWCSIRIRTCDVYYVEYPYLLTACVLVGIGLLSVSCAVYGIRRRSFYGAIFIIPLVLGFAMLVYIPDGTPHVQRSMMDDTNYLSGIHSFFGVWYESHQRFPKDEAEFKDALKQGPAAWQFRLTSPPLESDYAKDGIRLQYEIVVIRGATGPKLDALSERPGVIYYCLSADNQQFWVTMTGLHQDVSPKATLKTLADRPSDEPWLITASGKDYAFPKR